MFDSSDLIFYLVFVVVLLFSYLRKSSKKSKKTKIYKKKRKRNINREEETVLDLHFNNKDQFDFLAFGSFILSLFISLSMLGLILFIFIQLIDNDIWNHHKNKVIGLLAITFFFIFSFFYGRSRRWRVKIAKLKNRYKHKDLVFTASHLKISPFLSTDRKLNPELSGGFMKMDPEPANKNFLKVSWEELDRIEIYEIHHEDYTDYRYTIYGGAKDITLNRTLFADQEEEFFDLILSYKEIDIINRGRDANPASYEAKQKQRMITFVVIGFMVLYLMLDKKFWDIFQQ